MLSQIHVDIIENARHLPELPIVIHRGKTEVRCSGVTIKGPSRLVYPTKPLPCGARIYLVTDAEVVADE